MLTWKPLWHGSTNHLRSFGIASGNETLLEKNAPWCPIQKDELPGDVPALLTIPLSHLIPLILNTHRIGIICFFFLYWGDGIISMCSYTHQEFVIGAGFRNHPPYVFDARGVQKKSYTYCPSHNSYKWVRWPHLWHEKLIEMPQCHTNIYK